MMPLLTRRTHKGWLFSLMMVAVVFCGSLFASSAANATAWQTAPDVEVVQGNKFCPERDDGLAGRVVSCVQEIVIQAAENFLASFMAFYQPIVLASMILAVTLYGAVYLSGNVRRPAADTILLVLKIGAVMFFTFQFGGMTRSVFDIMEGLVGIVSNYSLTSPGVSLCSETNALPFTISPRANPTAWDKIDCMIITLFGIGLTTTVAAGLIVLLGSIIFSGGIGVIILLMALMFLLTLLVSIVRAIKVYLQAVVTVAFLICVSPLTLPCMLFSQTREIFKHWLHQFTAHMLIPVFIVAYLSMIVAAVDAIIFRGESSLYYAIAREPSQQPNFDFGRWIRNGEDGLGNYVGEDIPGTAAIGLLGYIETCTNGTAEEKAAIDLCELDPAQLAAMQRCAVNPWVADADGVDMPDIDTDAGETCEDIPAKMDNKGSYYYGFLTNKEMFAYSITPGAETDEQKREADQGCGWNPICGLGKLVGAVWEVGTWIVGQISRVVGAVVNAIGTVIKAVAWALSAPCRVFSGVAGDICNFATGSTALSFVGDVVHASGNVVNFGSRVLLDGFMSALGLERIDGFFDVQVLDLQKVASYRCHMDGGPSDPSDLAYLDCPGVGDMLIEFIYIIITAAVVMFLMLKWLPYIPVLAHALTADDGSSAYISPHTPGENMLSNQLHKAASSVAKNPTIKIKRRGGGE
ncbi:MAG: type IV secretion system protein [Alphaproteobacteria bacterium]|nr:type IV secretion system protein [Alphaproteobacteria bacterium]